MLQCDEAAEAEVRMHSHVCPLIISPLIYIYTYIHTYIYIYIYIYIYNTIPLKPRNTMPLKPDASKGSSMWLLGWFLSKNKKYISLIRRKQHGCSDCFFRKTKNTYPYYAGSSMAAWMVSESFIESK
jgi:hypothetical protein